MPKKKAKDDTDRGRPRILEKKFKTPKALRDEIDQWEKDCETNNKKKTVTRFGRRIEVDRATLYRYIYEYEQDDFCNALKKLWLITEEEAEDGLWKNTAAGIFTLVNNYQWKNRYETDMTSKGERLEGIVVSFQKP